ncbi:MAG TPA: glycosyltransferase family 2 protein [Mycobacteriales bacterium]|nr:glycosyltransferase family 2 protein [Mycobacteriales bacterium]
MVVVNYDTSDDVVAVLQGLDDPRLEVVVVDNASGQPPPVSTPNAQLLQLPTNAGWARGCNAGAVATTTPVLAFVNPDARPSADALLALAESLGDPSVGAVAPHFLNPDRSPQAFYFRFPGVIGGLFCFLPAGQRLDHVIGSPFIRHRTYDFGKSVPVEVDQPGAACLLLRRDDFMAMGGFDEDMFLFFADTDMCRRLKRQGKRVVVRSDVEVVHEGGASVRRLPVAAMREQFQRDYVTYLKRNHGRAAVAVTKVAALVLSGLLPAVWHLLRLRPRSSVEQLRMTMHVVRS